MRKNKVLTEINSCDGKVTNGNEWAKDLGRRIGSECFKHGKGFLFAPFGGSETNCRSFFMSSLLDPVEMGACLTMISTNFINSGYVPEDKVDEWINALAKNIKECSSKLPKVEKKGYEINETLD